MQTRKQSGFNLIEIMLALAIIGLVGVIAVPPLIELTNGLRVEMAAGQVAGAMNMARLCAIRYGTKVAVKFFTDETSGVVSYALYRDGDGDGVLSRDIETGVDPELRAPRRLAYFGERVHFGFPPGPPPRDPGNPSRRLDRLDDPIRFNRSDLASFSSLGTATPGSVYITDGRRHLAAVRTYNLSGKIIVLSYDVRTESWQ